MYARWANQLEDQTTVTIKTNKMTTTKTIPLNQFKLYRIRVAAVILMTLGMLVSTAFAQGRRGDHQSNGNNGGGGNRVQPVQQPRMERPTGEIRNASRRNDQPAMVNRPQRVDQVRNNPVPQQPRINNSPVANRNSDIARGNNNRTFDNNNRTFENRNNNSNRTFDNRNNDNRNNNVGRRDNNRPDFRQNPVRRNTYNNYNTYNSYNNNHYRPVYNSRNPNWGYSYLPRRSAFFNTLPSTYFSINFGGFGYRYYDGIYYSPYNNGFRVVAPPIGIHVNILPVGYRRIYVNDYPYYYFNGTYYDQRDNDDYYVVSPPVGAVVESLPDGYQTVVIDGETYYTADGAQYKPAVQEDGEIWYEVIKAN